MSLSGVQERELVALLLLSSERHVVVVVLLLILAVPWVGLWCVIVAFPGDTHLFFLLFMRTYFSMIK